MESQQTAHEAWVASLIPPPEASMAPDEADRAAMLDRRRQFIGTLMDQQLTEETLARARAEHMFMGLYGLSPFLFTDVNILDNKEFIL